MSKKMKELLLLPIFLYLCNAACPRGKYGPQCKSTCSIHCAGTSKECDSGTGECYQGCEVGYLPPTCQNECPVGTYGRDCEETCSMHCAGCDVGCNKVDGSCEKGCEPGYLGQFCSDPCPTGKFGLGCAQDCSDQCAGPDKLCNHRDGVCYFGCVKEYDQSPICRGRYEPPGTGPNVWGITMTVFFGVSFFANVYLSYRLCRAFKRQR